MSRNSNQRKITAADFQVKRKQPATPLRRRNRKTLPTRRDSSVTVSRTEVWFTSESSGAGEIAVARAWQAPTLPPWFAIYSRLWESYEVRNITVRPISNAAATTFGIGVISYEPNPAQALSTPPTTEILSGQHRAKTFKGSTTPSLRLDPAIFRQTPSRRWGPNAFLFSLYYRANFSTPISIRFEVSYTIVFHTPQLEAIPNSFLAKVSTSDSSDRPTIPIRAILNEGVGTLAGFVDGLLADPSVTQILKDRGPVFAQWFRRSPAFLYSSGSLRTLFRQKSSATANSLTSLMFNETPTIAAGILDALSTQFSKYTMALRFARPIPADELPPEFSPTPGTIYEAITFEEDDGPGYTQAAVNWINGTGPGIIATSFYGIPSTDTSIGDIPVANYFDQNSFIMQGAPRQIRDRGVYAGSSYTSSAVIPTDGVYTDADQAATEIRCPPTLTKSGN